MRSARWLRAAARSIPLIAERLSGRQETGEHDRELLELMSQGLGYEQMAERLGTTQEAVDRRVTQLFTRMAAQAEGGGASAVDEMKRLHAAVVQKQATATAFRSFVPEQVAAKLQATGSTELREELEATILFSDVRGYLHARRASRTRGGGRARRRSPRGDGRGDHRSRGDGRPVRGRRRDGRLRRARAERGPCRARGRLCARDAGPSGGAQRGCRDRRPAHDLDGDRDRTPGG